MSEPPSRGELPSVAMRLAPTIAVAIAIVAQILMRDPLVVGPTWFAPTVEVVLVIALVIGERVDRHVRPVRLYVLRYAVGLGLALSATCSTYLLIGDLVEAKPVGVDQLLVDGAGILIIAVVGFSVIFWQLDRGGPDGRTRAQTERLSFWFTQDAVREYSEQFDDWQPRYLDYLYLSSTNVTAFSPTDTMPLSRTAKMLMLWQSVLSLATLGLIFARAINILN